jgi:hypothetical protein
VARLFSTNHSLANGNSVVWPRSEKKSMLAFTPNAQTEDETQEQGAPNNTRRTLLLKVGVAVSGLIILALIILGFVQGSLNIESALLEACPKSKGKDEMSIKNMGLEYFRGKLENPNRNDISNIYQKIESIVLKNYTGKSLRDNLIFKEVTPRDHLIQLEFLFTISGKGPVSPVVMLLPTAGENLAQHYGRLIRSYRGGCLPNSIYGPISDYGPFALRGEQYFGLGKDISGCWCKHLTADAMLSPGSDCLLYALSLKDENIVDYQIQLAYKSLFNMLEYFLPSTSSTSPSTGAPKAN